MPPSRILPGVPIQLKAGGRPAVDFGRSASPPLPGFRGRAVLQRSQDKKRKLPDEWDEDHPGTPPLPQAPPQQQQLVVAPPQLVGAPAPTVPNSLSAELWDDIYSWVVKIAQNHIRLKKILVDPAILATLSRVERRAKQVVDRLAPLSPHKEFIRAGRLPVSGFFGQFAETAFTEDDYPAFAAMSQQIRKSFPPRAYAYVGLGRSPSPLLAELARTLNGGVFINLPLGGLSVYVAQDRYTLMQDERIRTRIFSHLDQFVAPHLLQGRKVLLMDYADAGKALLVMQTFLTAYYAAKNADVEIAIFAIANEVPSLFNGSEDQEVREMPGTVSVTYPAEDTGNLGMLINNLFGGELKKLSIDMFPSFAYNDLTGDLYSRTAKRKMCPAPDLAQTYRLLRLLKAGYRLQHPQ